MFRKTGVPVLGYVLNMSAYVCPSCGNKTPISSRSKPFESQIDVEKLGELPFNVQVGDCADEGNPVSSAHPDSPSVSIPSYPYPTEIYAAIPDRSFPYRVKNSKGYRIESSRN